MSEQHVVDPPDPARVVDILRHKALTDPGLALTLEAAEWKALYLEAVDIASETGDGKVTTTQPEGDDG